MSILDGVAAPKLTNTPAVIFSDPCRSRWFFFTKQIIVLFWVIIYSYLQRSFKIGLLKTLYTIHRKTTALEFRFNETATFLIKGSESLVPTRVYKFADGSWPSFIAQNLLVGTLKVHRLRFVTQNEMRWIGDEISKFLIFIDGSSLFICDLMIKVSNIREMPPILTIDLIFFKNSNGTIY